MAYRNLQECIADLDRTGQLVRIAEEVDPYLEAAEIQRRVYQAGGPAILMTRVKGCRFPMACNLFGTLSRLRFMFRDTIDAIQKLVELKVDAGSFFKKPWRFADVPRVLWNMRPKWVTHGPVLAYPTTISQLPQQVSWPDDGGAFITLPQVYTEDANRPGWQHSNLGMYRIQLSGGKYKPDRQVGMHYQIHRGIGVHHAAALRRGVPFRVNICVGGPPALAVAAVMPLPEGMPEITFAGALGGQRIRLIRRKGQLPILADVDFSISGTVDPELQLPEGPFGDHLGYYSLAHPFPVLNVDKVWHREGAIWPFTVVGRPPQEDTSFGQFIHELTGPVIPTVVKGVHAVHAVDAAGVHPLLLAIGSERYVPYSKERRPQELLTQANAILGQGQLSLAKYLLIVAREDNPGLNIHKIPAFLQHVLERVDWRTDLHLHTRTTIDTLDYSGTGLNEGSKAVIAVAGPPRRQLATQVPPGLQLPDGFSAPHICLPGILAVQAPKFDRGDSSREYEPALLHFCQQLEVTDALPLIVLVDDSDFTSKSLSNFLWVTFTRSNPAADIHGLAAFTHQKHWGCAGSLVIDARVKPQHAPPLVEDKKITQRVDALAAPGRPLHGII
ncbi:MAG: UbiD family decarboxylase [Planctomycetes bacterium]|nr:UbiD family decarboxylase [Planctomycetota bacterium]